MTQESIDALFKRYKETGDIGLRNQIVEKHLYIAEILAKKFVGRGVEYDDLYQVASYALLRAVDRFDPDKGMQFTTFITPTITGEIKNYFRDKSRIVKLPRRLGEISAVVKKYSAEYESARGRKPSLKEISQGLRLSEEEVVKALEVGGTFSLDGMVSDSEEGENKSLYALLASGEEAYEDFEIKETLRLAMKDFSDVEKAVVKYRYFDELSQSETAKRLNVSQMCISRTERRILAKLKERLKGAF